MAVGKLVCIIFREFRLFLVVMIVFINCTFFRFGIQAKNCYCSLFPLPLENIENQRFSNVYRGMKRGLQRELWPKLGCRYENTNLKFTLEVALFKLLFKILQNVANCSQRVILAFIWEGSQSPLNSRSPLGKESLGPPLNYGIPWILIFFSLPPPCLLACGNN